MTCRIAKRYAKALHETCREKTTLKAVTKDLKVIASQIDKSTDLSRFLNTKTLSKTRQEQAIKALYSKSTSPATLKFLLFLTSKSRLSLLKKICEAFDNIVLENNNVIRAAIHSSAKLSAPQVQSIKEHLKNKLHKEIQEEVFCEPKMIGGVKVRVGDTIYDYTMRAQLEEFRSNFLKAV